MQPYQFAVSIEVRDYEVDYQGIVNNANYLHYMEHTRHEFCKAAGFTFRDMHLQGIDPVLARAEIDYKTPLRIGESFVSCLNVERHGPRIVFLQDIYKKDYTSVVKAKITIACLENGRLTRGEILDPLLAFRVAPSEIEKLFDPRSI